MSELLAKLTNLGYELFGVILPGIVMSLFFLLWWTAIGPLAPVWTCGNLPEFTVGTARAIIESLNVASGIGVAVPAIALCYFAGHILLWVARSGQPNPDAAKCGYKRVWLSLLFRTPRPDKSFEPKLQGLFESVQKKFSSRDTPLEWREFYPVAKTFLAQRVSNSLVSTYQNKYTLHRSLTTAGALLFWMTLFSIVGALITAQVIQVHLPSYALLIALLVSALVLVWGFSASYMYHWEMFGNTIITETYARLCGPKDDKP